MDKVARTFPTKIAHQAKELSRNSAESDMSPMKNASNAAKEQHPTDDERRGVLSVTSNGGGNEARGEERTDVEDAVAGYRRDRDVSRQSDPSSRERALSRARPV